MAQWFRTRNQRSFTKYIQSPSNYTALQYQRYPLHPTFQADGQRNERIPAYFQANQESSGIGVVSL
jgi:hypothetical protein